MRTITQKGSLDRSSSDNSNVGVT